MFLRAFDEVAEGKPPPACDRGSKSNAQEYKFGWNGYKLHIDNRRGGEKEAFDPADAVRYHKRTAAEGTIARHKDVFGADSIWVRGAAKVMSHLMFGVLVRAADRLMIKKADAGRTNKRTAAPSSLLLPLDAMFRQHKSKRRSSKRSGVS